MKQRQQRVGVSNFVKSDVILCCICVDVLEMTLKGKFTHIINIIILPSSSILSSSAAAVCI